MENSLNNTSFVHVTTQKDNRIEIKYPQQTQKVKSNRKKEEYSAMDGLNFAKNFRFRLNCLIEIKCNRA